MNKIGRLCLITDTAIQKNYSHLQIAKMAVKGGADILQLRDKTLPTGKLIDISKKIAAFCREHKVLFIVNDRVDVVMASGADGVHLGNEDIPVKDARGLLGSRKIIGGTAHSLKEALLRQNEGADYVGFGHIYPTKSKFKPEKAKGTNMLSEVVKKVKIPVIAIGGISLSNIDDVAGTNVHGIAVIGSVLRSPEPVKTLKELKKKITGYNYGSGQQIKEVCVNNCRI
ncbi:MAG: thiamine phosphate synthase [Ignavibacteria bacterium]|nr:thiamine phosphate synthase [Ignavibacteria bacterium]